MASDKEYLDFILEQLSELEDVTWRAMMGEYILYFEGKVIGGIYDNRLLVKDVPPVRLLVPDCRLELPYEGGKPMIAVDDVDDAEKLRSIVEAAYDGVS